MLYLLLHFVGLPCSLAVTHVRLPGVSGKWNSCFACGNRFKERFPAPSVLSPTNLVTLTSMQGKHFKNFLEAMNKKKSPLARWQIWQEKALSGCIADTDKKFRSVISSHEGWFPSGFLFSHKAELSFLYCLWDWNGMYEWWRISPCLQKLNQTSLRKQVRQMWSLLIPEGKYYRTERMVWCKGCKHLVKRDIYSAALNNKPAWFLAHGFHSICFYSSNYTSICFCLLGLFPHASGRSFLLFLSVPATASNCLLLAHPSPMGDVAESE